MTVHRLLARWGRYVRRDWERHAPQMARPNWVRMIQTPGGSVKPAMDDDEAEYLTQQLAGYFAEAADPDTQRVIIAYYVNGYSVAQLAQRYNMRRTSVEAWLKRARRRVGRHLGIAV